MSKPALADANVLVTGHRGLVGSAVHSALRRAGAGRVLGVSRADVDLRDRNATEAAFASLRPDIVVHAAARVGGIVANASAPVEFLSDNVRMQTNVLDAAHHHDVPRLLFLGSSCIYPKHAPQPISEESLLTGPLEATNEAYAIAKIAGITLVQSYRREYGRAWISAMPTNLYGPRDNFDPESSHVLPALIRKMHEAKVRGDRAVVIWGTGTPRREFLHVDDLASACVFLIQHYDADLPVNVGCGSDLTIRELAELVADVVGFTGRIETDPSRPDGTPRKLLDTSRINALGWKPAVGLREGIAETYEWFRAEEASRHGI